MRSVPNSKFDYRKFPPAERLPAFRQLTASLYQAWALGKPESFQAEAFGHQVGELIFTEVEFGESRFKRSAEYIGVRVKGQSKPAAEIRNILHGSRNPNLDRTPPRLPRRFTLALKL
jgi:hypothetical protein